MLLEAQKHPEMEIYRLVSSILDMIDSVKASEEVKDIAINGEGDDSCKAAGELLDSEKFQTSGFMI